MLSHLFAMTGSVLNILADAVTTEKQIADIHERLVQMPPWAFDLITPLLIGIAVLVAVIFMRQKKIAQNQVNLARMLEEISSK